MNRRQLLAAKDAACAAVLRLGDDLRDGFGQIDHDTKLDSSVVTKLDRWAENELKKDLKLHDNTIGFLGEEHGAEGNEHTRWIIDPIDGTEHFIRGIPSCVTMVALMEGSKVKVSVLYNFVLDELYWAVKGEGAWCGERQLYVSQRPIDRAFVDISMHFASGMDLRLIQGLKDKVNGLTRFFGSGHTGMLIASGRIEGRASTHGKGGTWDYAPVGLLVEEAGGVVSRIDGSAVDYLNIDTFVVGNPETHKHILNAAKGRD